MKRNRSVWMVLSATLLLGCSGSNNAMVEPPPPTVTTAKPVKQKITMFVQRNGETRADDQADVRARVRGFIEKIYFEPGEIVKEGDALYEIEPDQYDAEKLAAEASVESAAAAIAVAEATREGIVAEVARAERDLTRTKQLRENNAASQAEYDQVLSTRDSAKAQFRSAEASIQAAKAELSRAEAALAQADLNVKYTTVNAPVSGRITRTNIERGNLADNGEPLATIVNRDLIYVYFTISDRELIRLMKQFPPGQQAGPENWAKVPVYLQRDETDENWYVGRLDYADQTGVDQSTGTFSLRGVFRNDKDSLLPGMFVSVRLPVSEARDALFIPRQAVQRSQQGIFVLAVDAENKVTKRPVKLGEKFDGWVMVESGLSEDDVFVVDGVQRARPGTVVDPTLRELSTDDSPSLKVAQAIAGSFKPGEDFEMTDEAANQTPESGEAATEPGDANSKDDAAPES